MKSSLFVFLFLAIVGISVAQDIPQHISYTRIYDFVDELANDGLIEINSVVKPYSRSFICDKLMEAKEKEESLNKRQQRELYFFLEEYAPEQDRLPEFKLPLMDGENGRLDLLPPVFHYNDKNFRARINPLLGMHVWHNSNGTATKRWFGIEFQGMIGKNLSIWGSLRDNSMTSVGGNMLSAPNYLNDQPGYQYKEATYGGDYSDSRGGIKFAWKSGSVGFVKDNIMWGDNYHGSNILSGRAPSFPMLTFNLKPAKWFELNFFHGFLISNVIDSTRYYVENTPTGDQKRYRPANKYMAANMMTFTPIRKLDISLGNAIVYAERRIQPAYFVPIAFYKSIDHTLTKGTKTENQNSMMFLNISSRNVKHLHLYTSIYVDEFNMSRLKSSNKEANPISYKLGAKLSNFPLQNVSVTGELTRTNIINYKHSVSVLTWASNDYNLGHYLGDNAQEIYLSLDYKPIRGLDVNLFYLNAQKGKDFYYLRGKPEGSNVNAISTIISQPSLGKKIWSNQTLGLKTQYEVFSNVYAFVNVEYSNIEGFENSDQTIIGENKMSAEEALKYFTPAFWQGKNTTISVGLSLGF